MEKQVEKDHYNFKNYCYLDRWSSYYYQIRELLNLSPKSIIEVGAGDNTVKEYVSNALLCKYTTVDIALDLNPDIVAPIDNIPVSDNSYDIVCAFEVLEHIPYENVESALIELKRVADKYLIISVPHFGPTIKFNFKIPIFPEIKFAYKIPFPLKHEFNGQHYWELGKRKYSLYNFRKMLEKHFVLIKDFVPFENQYHHFYILEKK